MGGLRNIYRFIIREWDRSKFTLSNKSRPGMIANAIKKRNPVSFFYNGPRGKVQAGKRYKVELVALGLSKKGNMIVRGWVEPPSRTKSGFEKGHWRTFMVSRMNQVEIFDEETFDQKRPGYKEGDDGSMIVTYATSDWGTTQPTPQQEPETQPQQEPTPQQPEPQEPETTTTEPERTSVDPENLPQPEPENRPSMEPPVVDDEEPEDEEEPEELQENLKRIKELLYN